MPRQFEKFSQALRQSIYFQPYKSLLWLEPFCKFYMEKKKEKEKKKRSFIITADFCHIFRMLPATS